jgi:hypothetical protein
MMAKKDEGYLLDGSGQRVKSGSGEYVRSGSYDDEKVTENRMEAARNKLAQDVQKKLKDDSDSARVSKDAEQGAKAPAAPVKMPTRPGQGATSAKMPTRPGQGAKPSVVTKEQLAKSGFDNLRDYMNAQKGLTRRDGKAPEAPQKEKSAAEKRSATRTADVAAKKPQAERRSDTRLRASNASANAAGAARAIRYNSIPDEVYNPGSEAAAYAERGMKKGGSINGIAKRGLTKCKMR